MITNLLLEGRSESSIKKIQKKKFIRRPKLDKIKKGLG